VIYNERQKAAISPDDPLALKTLKNDTVILKNMEDTFALSVTAEKLVCCIEDELAGLDSLSRSAKTAAAEATKLHAEQSKTTSSTSNLNGNSNTEKKRGQQRYKLML
jgi:hypothetical protein